MGDTATTAPNVISLTGLAAGIWPRSARLETDGEITIGGVRLSTLAARYGTPAYIIDEADVRYRCRTYSAALPGAEIAYAGKAFLCRAMARWIEQEGLSLDVCSAGELAVARSARFPADRRDAMTVAAAGIGKSGTGWVHSQPRGTATKTFRRPGT